MHLVFKWCRKFHFIWKSLLRECILVLELHHHGEGLQWGVVIGEWLVASGETAHGVSLRCEMAEADIGFHRLCYGCARELDGGRVEVEVFILGSNHAFSIQIVEKVSL